MKIKIVFALLILSAAPFFLGCGPQASSLESTSESKKAKTERLATNDSGKNEAKEESSLAKEGDEPDSLPTDWRQFRGERNLSVTDAELPREFDSSFVQWKAELIGRGASTPIVVGEKIFLTSYSGYGESLEKPGKIADLQHHVYCFDRKTGSLNWLRNIKGNPAENSLLNPNLVGHGFASSSMTSDGEKVFAFFGIAGVFAFDLDGEFLWQQDVGWGSHNFGSSASLATHQNLLIVNASVESEAVYALDKETGTGVWKIDDVLESWTTPVLGETADGAEELVVAQKNVVRGFDPETGKELWTCEGILDYIVPTPVVVEGIAYCNGGKQNRTLAIRLGGRGDVTKSHKLWESEVGANVISSIFHDGHIYQVNDPGVLQVVDAKTGEVVKRERLKRSGSVFGSPLLSGEAIFFPLIHGIAVVNATPELGVISRNTITDDEGEFRASIAVTKDRMLTRNDNFLFCIAPNKQESSKHVVPKDKLVDQFETVVSKAKYDFDEATGRVRFYNRCLLKTPHELRGVILNPYKSVITEKQTALSLELIREEFPKFDLMRLQRREIIWNRMSGKIAEEEFLEQIAALEKKTIKTQAQLRMPIKKMFSKEQMDQHMAEHRAWLEKNKKK